MVNEEIYILTKHVKFQAEYIENIPIYKRRHFLHLFEKEREKIEEMQDNMNNKFNKKPRS